MAPYMMSLLKMYISHKSFRVNQPRAVVFRYLSERVKESNVINDNIQIKLKPTIFDGFAPRGIINLSLKEIEKENQTQIDAEIIPGSFTKEDIYIISGIFSLFILTGLLVSFSWGTFVVILISFIVMILIIHWTQLLNQGKLENYIAHLVAETNHLKEHRIA